MMPLFKWSVMMPSEEVKILEFNQYHKSGKKTIDFLCRCWIFDKKKNWCENNTETLSTIKLGEHIPQGFALSTIWSFKDRKNKHDGYRGEDCIKKFCECLKKHVRG